MKRIYMVLVLACSLLVFQPIDASGYGRNKQKNQMTIDELLERMNQQQQQLDDQKKEINELRKVVSNQQKEIAVINQEASSFCKILRKFALNYHGRFSAPLNALGQVLPCTNQEAQVVGKFLDEVGREASKVLAIPSSTNNSRSRFYSQDDDAEDDYFREM